MDLLATARFHVTVVRGRMLDAANPQGLPEVAFVGRSNAGKSSCLNLLCNRRRLAFSSRTPGRTQALNFFAVGPVDGASGYLVDTPGYGYAAAGKDARESWQALGGEYMRRGPPLAAAVLLVDIRRELTALDGFLLSWIPSALKLIVVLTKADKLPFGQRRQVLRRVAEDPRICNHVGGSTTLLFSATERIGLDELKQAVTDCLDVPPLLSAPAQAPDAASTRPLAPTSTAISDET